jgi:hypothetical protein
MGPGELVERGRENRLCDPQIEDKEILKKLGFLVFLRSEVQQSGTCSELHLTAESNRPESFEWITLQRPVEWKLRRPPIRLMICYVNHADQI